MEFNISHYQFLFTPHTLKSKHPLNGMYVLQLEKGCQRIKEIKELMDIANKKQFNFRSGEFVTAKIFKQRNMTFGWSLYKTAEDRMEFIDVLKFDLHPLYLAYIEELKKYPLQYSRILQTKPNHLQTTKSWLNMKSHLSKYKHRQTLTNSAGDFSLDYTIQIKSDLDLIAQIQLKKTAAKKSQTHSQKHKQKIEDTSIIKDSQTHLNIPFKQNQPFAELTIQSVLQLEFGEKKESHAALSDIIEQSHQQTQYHGERTDRSDRKPSEFGLKLDINANANFQRAKTYHFVNDQESQEEVYKRNNSLETIKVNQNKEQLKIESQIDKKEEKHFEELTNESSSIVKPQVISPNGQTTTARPPQPAITLKEVIIIILIIAILGSISYILVPVFLKRIKSKSLIEPIKPKNIKMKADKLTNQ